MSTRLKTLNGKKEIGVATINTKAVYSKEKLYLNSFYGGIKRGKSLQIRIGNSHIQLDNKTVLEMVDILINNYN